MLFLCLGLGLWFLRKLLALGRTVECWSWVCFVGVVEVEVEVVFRWRVWERRCVFAFGLPCRVGLVYVCKCVSVCVLKVLGEEVVGARPRARSELLFLSIKLCGSGWSDGRPHGYFSPTQMVLGIFLAVIQYRNKL